MMECIFDVGLDNAEDDVGVFPSVVAGAVVGLIFAAVVCWVFT